MVAPAGSNLGEKQERNRIDSRGDNARLRPRNTHPDSGIRLHPGVAAPWRLAKAEIAHLTLVASAAITASLFLARFSYELRPLMVSSMSPGVFLACLVSVAFLVTIVLIRASTTAVRPHGRNISIVLPFAFLLVYLLWPEVNLLAADVLFAATVAGSLWLGMRDGLSERQYAAAGALMPWMLAVGVVAVYLVTLGQTVGTADTFEFQVVAPTLGIAHPTGYPLFILLGKLFSMIPIGLVAWRINLVSAVSATLAVVLVYITLARLTGRHAAPAIAACALAFSRGFWSQAVQAEVYALNALFVAGILALLLPVVFDKHAGQPGRRWLLALAMLSGLGLTHHLTMALLMPALLLGLCLARPRLGFRNWSYAAILFAIALSVVLYVPLRWPALHDGQWMSLHEFLAWITGRRFAGALQFELWNDPARWELVGSLLLGSYGVWGAALAAGGLAWLTFRARNVALVSFLAWAAYVGYAVVYNVPDISVFLIPAHLIMALWLGIAMARILERLAQGKISIRQRRPLATTALVAFALLPLSLLWTTLPQVDQSESGWDLYQWGRFVFSLPLESGATILADSEKVAPLYYLGHIEKERPDINTMVLADEQAYRAELQHRLALEQSVYLARYLPGLEGQFSLQSVGPLVRVAPHSGLMPDIPQPLTDVTWSDGAIALLGYKAERGEGSVAWRVTLYWSTPRALDSNYHVRLRWVGTDGTVWWQDRGAHPVNNQNPMVAWIAGEVVPDYHEIPNDPSIPPGDLRLQVALYLPFEEEGLKRDAGAGDSALAHQTEPAWYTVGILEQVAPDKMPPLARTLRAAYGGEILISGASETGLVVAGESAEITLDWSRWGPGHDRDLQLHWVGEKGIEGGTIEITPYAGAYPTSHWPQGKTLRSHIDVQAPSTAGVYTLRAGWLSTDGHRLPARCSWHGFYEDDCPIARVQVLPPAGTDTADGTGQVRASFDDQVLLLDNKIEPSVLRPGETVAVWLKWQNLRPWPANYTAFVHLLGPDGKLYGQMDRWLRDGTLATLDWEPGTVIEDSFKVQLSENAPSGNYQVEAGWYLLGTLRRLPVLDEDGRVVEDRVIVGTVQVEP